MAVTNKPASGTYTVNTGHAKCPDHLYLLNDSTGGTTVADSVGSLNMTSDSTAMWQTGVDAGADGPGGETTSQILRFVSTSSYKAVSGNTFSASSGLCLVVMFKSDDAVLPATDQYVMSMGHDTTAGRYGGVGTSGSDGYLDGRVCTDGSITNVKTISTNVRDEGWHMVAVKTNDSTGSDGVTSLSLDGAAWQSNSGTGNQDVAEFNRLGLGYRAATVATAYLDGDMLAAYAYIDDYSSWDNTWIASLYSDPWQFLNTTPVSYAPTMGRCVYILP